MINTLKNKIDRFKNWSDEDIPIGPTDDVLDIVKELVPELVYHDLIPFRVTPCIDGGLCLVFNKPNTLIYIEFYNDGGIGLISEDTQNKKMLENIDLTKENLIGYLT